MNSLNVGRRALALCGVVAIPAGCGPGAPGAVQSSSIERNAIQDGSEVMPEWKGDLIYTSNVTSVFIFTPGGNSAGMLPNVHNVVSLCSDAKGHVFVLTGNKSERASTIYEYAHGGKRPIAKLSDPGIAFGCAFDRTTGNLAVANIKDYSQINDQGDIAIYPSEMGPPTIYFNKAFANYWFCGYDDEGNLYASGREANQPRADLAGLAKGSKSIKKLTLDRILYWNSDFYPSVQWDGSHITISNRPRPRKFIFAVYQLSIRGTTATVVGTTTFTAGRRNKHLGQIELKYGSLVAPYTYVDKSSINYGRVGYWPYPGGGRPRSFISVDARDYPLWGLTISVPTH